MAVTSRTRAVVVDTSRSPHARLRPVPVSAVHLADAFWAPRLATNRRETLPGQHRLLEETGRLDNFRRAAGKLDGPYRGRVFNDSDVYKWLEAAAWALAAGPDPELERMVATAIAVVAAAQRPDGYLNSYFARDHASERWTDFDLHEMYCAGHLFQAAVAHHRATGSTTLLDVATRFADHIDATFGPPEHGKRIGTDGHPEVEMALVELARETGERRYLELAKFLLDVRGHGLLGDAFGRFGPDYHQDHRPFRELNEIVGHAVRALYLNAGAADLYAETGEPALLAALHRLWADATHRKTYVTGGLGARHEGEAFGAAYELPNARAYAETCAAIANAMWNWRMLLLSGEARYADAMERSLYNNVLAGVSLTGDTYFYVNPLADDGGHRRRPWFGTACCPPNVARTLAALPGHAYAVAAGGLWVHLYAAGRADLRLPDGPAVRLEQRTAYPWDGDVELEVQGEGEFALHLRVPGWCESGASLAVNGRSLDTPLAPRAYAEVRRAWTPGDTVRLRLPMPVRRLASHPRVLENAGRVALARGPLVYCVEAADNPGLDPRDLVLPAAGRIDAAFRPDLLGGTVALSAEAVLAPPDAGWADRLYRPAEADGAVTDERPVTATATPYAAWANRDPGPMLVWLRARP